MPSEAIEHDGYSLVLEVDDNGCLGIELLRKRYVGTENDIELWLTEEETAAVRRLLLVKEQAAVEAERQRIFTVARDYMYQNEYEGFRETVLEGE